MATTGIPEEPNFLSIQDGFDTSTASGKMVFLVIGTMAEYERNLIRERTMEGLAARDRMGGRPKSLDESQVKVAIALAESGELTINEICEQIGCSRSTLLPAGRPNLGTVVEDTRIKAHATSLVHSELKQRVRHKAMNQPSQGDLKATL